MLQQRNETSGHWLRIHKESQRIAVSSFILLIASSLIAFGAAWDAFWHSSVGRDSFWIPPHLLLYLGPLLPILTLISRLGVLDERSHKSSLTSIHRDHGFLGYAVAGIGSGTMMFAAAFDGIWHRTIGDIAIWTPPHVLGAVGGILVAIGAIKTALHLDSGTSRRLWSDLSSVFLFGVLLLTAYFGALPAAAVAYLPGNISFPAFHLGSATLLAAIAVSTACPLFACARNVLGPNGLNKVILMGLLLWGAVETFHGVFTAPVAQQLGYALRHDPFYTRSFRLAVLMGLLLPILFSNFLSFLRIDFLGSILAMTYIFEIVLGARALGITIHSNAIGVLAVTILGACFAHFGDRFGLWLRIDRNRSG